MIGALVLHCVIVAGLGGEAEYQQRFTQWAHSLEQTFKAAGPEVQTQVLEGSAATRDAVKKAIQSAGSTAGADDSLMLVLIGHGGFDGAEYKLILPGPDLSGTELATLLDSIKVKQQLIVNTTSASGGALAALEHPGRLVISATKTGTERNATVFARYFVDALRDGAADTDHNEVITAGEAFKYAEQKTKQFYDTNKRLSTEHPSITNGNTRFAVLRSGALQAATQTPEKKALLTKREQLETQIEDLKLRKAALDAAEYRKQLQTLLLELARTQEKLDQ